jgi:hypothetical protein
MSILDQLMLSAFEGVRQPTLQGFQSAFNRAMYDPAWQERYQLGLLSERMKPMLDEQRLQLDPLRVGAAVSNAQTNRARFDDRLDAEARRRERMGMQGEIQRQNAAFQTLAQFAPEVLAQVNPDDLASIQTAAQSAPALRQKRIGRESGARAGAAASARQRVEEQAREREFLGAGVMGDTLPDAQARLEQIRAAGASVPMLQRQGGMTPAERAEDDLRSVLLRATDPALGVQYKTLGQVLEIGSPLYNQAPSYADFARRVQEGRTAAKKKQSSLGEED